MSLLKPVKRSSLRIYCGKKYYRLMRYFNWYLGKKKYATRKENSLLPHVVFQYKTPLLRKLKGVDMWLQYNKVKNLEIASNKLNRIIIEPSETFSYWRLIGNTTRKKGYVDAMVLFYGKVTTGVGGGLCQLSNLIYWMTLHSPLTVTERYRHSYDVFPDSKRSQPFGSGATCAYNYLDLQIKNETNYNYQLVVYLTDTDLIGEWRVEVPPTRRYEVYEKEHWITHEFWGGYLRHNKIHRKVYNLENELIDDEFITENHAIMMYEPMLDSGNLK
ncbi:VanW family protein [Alkaliphilus metalliredigens QYMF]|uniref:VanW family protein n=1 Tax=Alkaliphilus metalliredigens (strain QYMF) TaxID=293826 RepID=A6TN57_ALKMQ|nr:VanW family protein [Alkaliphilus metalliredigens]ABR47625.1 VanW family protein [Alkaliphilus metalliredigens QYMF]